MNMKAKTFSGGYKFEKFIGQPQDRLEALSIPPQVIIPLLQGLGSPLKSQVKIGDEVRCGQIIARDENVISSPVHSSINGKVIQISKMNYFNREVEMVIIEKVLGGDFKKGDNLLGQPDEERWWENAPVEEIEEVLYKSGVTSLDREGIPTRFKTSFISPGEVEDLIIHGVGSESYNISLELLLEGKNLYNFVEGLKILKKIMPGAKVHLALNEKNKEIIERVGKLTVNLDRFDIFPVVAKYPQGYDEVLIPTLLGKKFPYGYSAANIGIVVLNIQAVLGVYEAIGGKPLIERTIALCGPSFKENLHIRVRVGTPLEFIIKGRLKEGPHRLILNSLLTGFELKDLSLPVDRTFSQIIAIPENRKREFLTFLRLGPRRDSYSGTFPSKFLKISKTLDTNFHGEQRPCIQCGYCISACPVGINPTLLDRISKVGINETLMRYGIFNCIDCNLCTYVCPSKISLAKNLKQAKNKLIEAGCDNYICILPKFNLKGLEEYKGIKVTR